MRILKKSGASVPREDAHGSSGGRRVYLDRGEIDNVDWQAMTYGYLPGGGSFDFHEHAGTDEVMLVVKGSGTVHDRDGEYSYSPGDLFVFPAGTEHAIRNPTDEEHEYVFVRVAVRH